MKAKRNTIACPEPLEEEEQAALFAWAEYASGTWPELKLLHAIPNGGHRAKATAAMLKRTGVKAGVPDIMLPCARHGCNGLYIELKRRKGGRLSPEQMAWMEALMREGYRCAMCRGWDEARTVIMAYIGDGAEG